MTKFVNKFKMCLLAALALATPLEAVSLVSLSPQVTEILFSLGKGGDVVGTSPASDYPAQAKAIPRIGALFMPSIETVLRLAPDWILFDAALPNPSFEKATEVLPSRRFRFDLASPEQLFDAADGFLHQVYGEKTSPVVERWRRCWDLLPHAASFSFLALTWTSPTVAFGPGTFLSRLIERVGGTNAVPSDWTPPFPQLTDEWLIAHPVDTVYYVSAYSGDDAVARQAVNRWWPSHPPRFVVLSSDNFARASFTPLAHWRELVSAPPGGCSGIQ